MCTTDSGIVLDLYEVKERSALESKHSDVNFIQTHQLTGREQVSRFPRQNDDLLSCALDLKSRTMSLLWSSADWEVFRFSGKKAFTERPFLLTTKKLQFSTSFGLCSRFSQSHLVISGCLLDSSNSSQMKSPSLTVWNVDYGTVQQDISILDSSGPPKKRRRVNVPPNGLHKDFELKGDPVSPPEAAVIQLCSTSESSTMVLATNNSVVVSHMQQSKCPSLANCLGSMKRSLAYLDTSNDPSELWPLAAVKGLCSIVHFCRSFNVFVNTFSGRRN